MALESPGPWKRGNGTENPRTNYVQWERPMTHAPRSRQLPTNHNHAALRVHARVTREYQFDSPSITAAFPGPGLSRDGPKR
jgi:hypothetical protein